MTNGERISWRGLNRNYTGIIIGNRHGFALVKIDGTEKSVLLSYDYCLTHNRHDKDMAR